MITSLKAEQKFEHKAKLKTTETSPEIHLQQIKRFIGLHIKDYRLSVDFIAQAENISKRYLHMLFKDLDVSVSRYIQQLRLEGCHKNLTNKEFNHISTSEISCVFDAPEPARCALDRRLQKQYAFDDLGLHS